MPRAIPDIALLERVLDRMENHKGYHLRAIYALLGQAYLDTRQYEMAYAAGEKGLEWAIKRTPEILAVRRGPIEVMYKARRATGDFEEALDLLTQLNDIDRQLASERSRSRIDSLEILHQTEAQETEILEQQLELSRKTTQRNLILALAVVLCIGLLAIWQRMRGNRRLAEQRAVIQRQRIAALETENKLIAMDAMIAGQEQERKRVAKDLHDGLGGLLSSVRIRFEALIRGSQKDVGQVTDVTSLLEDASDEVRRIAHDMMPKALSTGGLHDAVEDLGNTLQQAHGIDASVVVIDLPEDMDERLEITLYRILQESVANIVKHAEATQVIIQLSGHGDHIMLDVEDNGKGFDLSGSSDGLGLKSLRSRVDYLQGQIDIDTAPGEGTSISISVPVRVV